MGRWHARFGQLAEAEAVEPGIYHRCQRACQVLMPVLRPSCMTICVPRATIQEDVSGPTVLDWSPGFSKRTISSQTLPCLVWHAKPFAWFMDLLNAHQAWIFKTREFFQVSCLPGSRAEYKWSCKDFNPGSANLVLQGLLHMSWYLCWSHGETTFICLQRSRGQLGFARIWN